MADVDQTASRPKRVGARRGAPETPDPIDLAMVQASGSAAAQRLLEKQAFLIDADLEHRRLQIGGERLKRMVWFVLALLAGSILLGAIYAVAAFEQAAERAPRWGELHLDWARALWASGWKEEAVGKLRAAATMGLEPANAERLRRMWTVAKSRA